MHKEGVAIVEAVSTGSFIFCLVCLIMTIFLRFERINVHWTDVWNYILVHRDVIFVQVRTRGPVLTVLLHAPGILQCFPRGNYV